MELLQNVNALIQSQVQNWGLAKQNFEQLGFVQTKEISLPGSCTIKVQYNPGRIHSSSAKVDAKSIQKRACFLCASNRPPEQEGVGYKDMLVLVNPFPIFPQHLTIPSHQHQLQLILPHFNSMLHLAKELNDFTLFYNGPQCGASAPDHFHFQAGNKGFLPIEEDFRSGFYAKLIADYKGVKLFNWKDYHRGIISLKGEDIAMVDTVFKALCKQLPASEPEPMLNILSYFEDGEYIVHVFPRAKHRPDCYFKNEDEQLLISPASVDMGGVFITPRQEDFEKINAEYIQEILNQVCLSEDECERLLDKVLRDCI